MLVYYVLPLTILFWYLCFNNLKKDYYEKYFYKTILIQFLLLFGMRAVGILDEYSEIWKATNPEGPFYSVYSERLEPGFLIFNKFIFKHISSNPNLYFFIVIFVSVGATIYYMRLRAKDIYVPLLLYVGQTVLFLQITAFRQGIAMSILLFAYLFMEKKKYLQAICLILLGVQFHQTAIVGLVIIPLYFLKLSKRNVTLFFIAGIISLYLLGTIISYFGQGDSKYLEDGDFKIGNIINIILFTGLIWLCYKYKRDILLENSLLVWCSLMCIVCSAMSLFVTALNRTIDYFAIPAFVLFSLCFQKNGTLFQKRVRNYFIFISMLMYYVIIIFKPEWHHTTDFKFFWE